jgi:hypothetical protein
VLDDAVVDFVFVAMIDVVEQVKVLLFIWNVGKLEWFFLIFFSFLTQVPHVMLFSVLSQKKRKFLRRNLLTTKERQKSEKNNDVYIACSV